MNAPPADSRQERNERRREARLPAKRATDREQFVPAPRRRWEDLGPWERVLRGAQHVVPGLLMLQTVLLAVGWRIERPNDRIASMESVIRELRARRDSDHAEFMVLLNRTNALARYRCLYMDAETAYQLGLDCNVLLPGYQMRQRTIPAPGDEGVTMPSMPRIPTQKKSQTPDHTPPFQPVRAAGFLPSPRFRWPEHMP